MMGGRNLHLLKCLLLSDIGTIIIYYAWYYQNITKKFEEKLERLESVFEVQKKQIEENNSKIASLELRLDEFEKKFSNEKKSKDRKVKILKL